MTPLALIQYYANLLILQYLQKPKAYATVSADVSAAILPQTSVQKISFGTTPSSGTFILSWTPFGINQMTVLSAAINWNDSAATVQTKLQAMTGLGSVTVSGAITSSAGLTVTFTGVNAVAPLLVVSTNSLGVMVAIAETDVVLPLAVAAAFNINAALGPVAVGIQLDILGKYVGVTRTSSLPSIGTITLSDADFLTLIQFASLKNSAGSDLATIQTLIAQFFSGEILVFDYQNMYMSYLISTSVGSLQLAQALVAEGLLFRPTGVTLAAPVFVANILIFFGFRTYFINTIHNTPANTYTSYQSNRPWLTYADAVVI